MSAEEFWKDDPQLFVSYRTSFINKKKREMEEQDYICWLQGLYVYKATINSEEVLRETLTNMFSKKKINFKIDPYPDKPYSEKQREDESKEKNKEIKYKEFENSLQYYGTLKQQYLEKLKNKKKGE